MHNKQAVALFWFRRDLRLDDNCGLDHALRSGFPVVPVFIFDPDILQEFESPHNRQVCFIHERIQLLQRSLKSLGSNLLVLHETPLRAFEQLLRAYTVKAVFCNEDYEHSAQLRDGAVAACLQSQGIAFHSFKDQVIFAKNDILKSDHNPYTVFTPYSRRWKQRFALEGAPSYDCRSVWGNFVQTTAQWQVPALQELGFAPMDVAFPGETLADTVLEQYEARRDYPALEATSGLGIHLRFGTLSIRPLVRRAETLSDCFLNELIWREFYHAITWHFPHIGRGESFNPQYDALRWRNSPEEFAAWRTGKTGYPLVDAGMRQLGATGIMHNRVRMVAASFLVKHLLIDWRWGEAYFKNQLLDYDFAANNGGWQWSAASGCDAAPYFRVFNPHLQAKNFDKESRYIRRWLPEWGGPAYPAPLVAQDFARQRALTAFQQALSANAKAGKGEHCQTKSELLQLNLG